MEKLKKLISNASVLLETVYKKFPITMVIIYAVTVLFVIGTDDFIDKLYDSGWMFTIGFSIMGTVFAETWFKDKIKQYPACIITTVIAIVFKVIYDMELSDKVGDIFGNVYMSYAAVLSLLTIYKTIKDSNVTVEEYFLKAFANWGRITWLYMLANLGITVVIGAFVTLLLDGNDLGIISKVFTILVGCYYVPSLLHCATDMTQEHGKIIKALILYVSTPVTVFLLAIFYLYLGKETLSGRLFEKEIFGVLSWVYALGVPVALMIKNYDKTGKLKMLSKYLLIAFIPVIVLQSIALTIRVSDYGLTTDRYMGYILILFEIILSTVSLYKEGMYLDKIFLILIGFVAVFILSPFNYLDYPMNSQAMRLEKMVSDGFDNMDEEDKIEAKKLYTYLKRREGQDNMYRYIDQEELQKIDLYTFDESKYSDKDGESGVGSKKEYIYASSDIDGVDISGYSKIYEIYTGYSDEITDYKNVKIKDKEKNVEVFIDFEDFVEGIIEAEIKDEEDEFLEREGRIKSKTGNELIILTKCNLDYELYSEKITDVDIEGYILVK